MDLDFLADCFDKYLKLLINWAIWLFLFIAFVYLFQGNFAGFWLFFSLRFFLLCLKRL